MMQNNALTKNQKLVLTVLEKADAPMSAYDILDRLRNKGIKAPLQVYRALAVLTDKSICHRLESLNAFVACSDTKCAHGGMTGFVICNSCGNAQEFSDTSLNRRIHQVAQNRDFQSDMAVVEIKGTCADCAKNQERPSSRA